MKRILLAEECKVVNMWPAKNLNNGATYTDVVNMEDYETLNLIIQSGGNTVGATVQVTCYETTGVTAGGGVGTLIGFDSWEITASSDTVRAKAAVGAASHYTVPASKNVMAILAVDAKKLTAGYGFVEFKFSDPGAATYLSAVAVLTGNRYSGVSTPTAIA